MEFWPTGSHASSRGTLYMVKHETFSPTARYSSTWLNKVASILSFGYTAKASHSQGSQHSEMKNTHWASQYYPPRQQELVDLGNRLAAWALSFIQAIHVAGGYFTVENPYLSWLWWLPDWVLFKQSDGVIGTLLQQRVYGWITKNGSNA